MEQIRMEQEEFKRHFHEEFKKRNPGSQMTQEEIEAELRKQFGAQPISRLELFYNPKTNALLLQGNARGLEAFRDLIAGLIESNTGHYFQLDEFTNLTETNLARWIIRRVGDDDFIVDQSTFNTPDHEKSS